MSELELDHRHKYLGVKYIPLIADNKLYKGEAKHWAILVRTCSCGDMQAFEMGERKAMAKIAKEYQDE